MVATGEEVPAAEAIEEEAPAVAVTGEARAAWVAEVLEGVAVAETLAAEANAKGIEHLFLPPSGRGAVPFHSFTAFFLFWM